MSRYAATTVVSAERSRGEIEATLMRYGASEFAYGTAAGKAMIGFRMNSLRIRFFLPLPDKTAREFTHTPSRETPRTAKAAYAAWEQAGRQRWRALALAIKAKLEAVESGITTFEEEFLAHVVLPNGESAGGWLIPQIAHAYENKKMPPLLPFGGK